MTLLGKKVRSRGKGQYPIKKGQLQYHAHIICNLELGVGPRIFPICVQIYDITRECSMYMSTRECCTLLMHILGPNDMYSGCLMSLAHYQFKIIEALKKKKIVTAIISPSLSIIFQV